MKENPLTLQLRKIIIKTFAVICILITVVILYKYLPVYFEFNKIPERATVSMIDKNNVRTDYLSLKGDIDVTGGFEKEYRKGRRYIPIFNMPVGTEYYYPFRDSSSGKSIFIRMEKYPGHYELKYNKNRNISGIWKEFDAADSAEIERLSSEPDIDRKVLSGSVKAKDLLRELKKPAQSKEKINDRIILSGYLDTDIDKDNISFNKNNTLKLGFAVILFLAGMVLITKNW